MSVPGGPISAEGHAPIPAANVATTLEVRRVAKLHPPRGCPIPAGVLRERCNTVFAVATSEVAAEPTWNQCPSPECGGASVGSGKSCIAHLDDEELSVYLARLGRLRMLDARGAVITPDLLERILAAAAVDGAGRRRLIGPGFERAVFVGDPSFDGVAFGRGFSFDGAEFRGDVSFREAVFESSARFARVLAAGEAHFEEAVFEMDAWFAGAIFQKNASFQRATFKGPARFAGVTFQADVRFDQAIFHSNAWFEKAAFESLTDFTEARFEGDARFARTTFAREASFHGAAFEGIDGIPDVAASKSLTWSGPLLAPWPKRMAAALIDLAIPAAFCLSGAVVAIAMTKIQHAGLVPYCLVGGVLLALYSMMVNLASQGRTGQSRGKEGMGLRLVGERDRRPLGVRLSIIRQLLHLADVVPLLIGLLWAVRDEKRQTFADKILGTVVVTVGGAPRKGRANGF